MASPCRSFTCAMKALTLAFAMRCADGFQRGASDMTRQILIARSERIEDLVGVLAHARQRPPDPGPASAEQLIDDPHLKASGGLVPMPTDDGASTQVVLLPLLLGGRRPGVRRALPRVGEHTDEVLDTLAPRD